MHSGYCTRRILGMLELGFRVTLVVQPGVFEVSHDLQEAGAL